MIPKVADRYWLQLLGCRTPPKRLPEALSDRPARGDALQILNGVAHGPTRSLTSEESMSDENKMNFAPSTTSAQFLTTESKRTSSNHWPTRSGFAVCAVGVHVEMIGLSEGTQGLIVARRDRHASWLCRAERAGANNAAAKFIFRTRLCVSVVASRSDRSSRVERRRAVFARKMFGTWAFCVPASEQRHGFTNASPAIDVAGKHRLAAHGAQLGSANGSLTLAAFFCLTISRIYF
jgi:hypothetical protein